MVVALAAARLVRVRQPMFPCEHGDLCLCAVSWEWCVVAGLSRWRGRRRVLATAFERASQHAPASVATELSQLCTSCFRHELSRAAVEQCVQPWWRWCAAVTPAAPVCRRAAQLLSTYGDARTVREAQGADRVRAESRADSGQLQKQQQLQQQQQQQQEKRKPDGVPFSLSTKIGAREMWEPLSALGVAAMIVGADTARGARGPKPVHARWRRVESTSAAGAPSHAPIVRAFPPYIGDAYHGPGLCFNDFQRDIGTVVCGDDACEVSDECACTCCGDAPEVEAVSEAYDGGDGGSESAGSAFDDGVGGGGGFDDASQRSDSEDGGAPDGGTRNRMASDGGMHNCMAPEGRWPRQRRAHGSPGRGDGASRVVATESLAAAAAVCPGAASTGISLAGSADRKHAAMLPEPVSAAGDACGQGAGAGEQALCSGRPRWPVLWLSACAAALGGAAAADEASKREAEIALPRVHTFYGSCRCPHAQRLQPVTMAELKRWETLGPCSYASQRSALFRPRAFVSVGCTAESLPQVEAVVELAWACRRLRVSWARAGMNKIYRERVKAVFGLLAPALKLRVEHLSRERAHDMEVWPTGVGVGVCVGGGMSCCVLCCVSQIVRQRVLELDVNTVPVAAFDPVTLLYKPVSVTLLYQPLSVRCRSMLC